MSLGADFKVINFIQSRDRPAAVAFYRDVLGLTFVMDDPFASVLDQNGTRLRITQSMKALAKTRWAFGTHRVAPPKLPGLKILMAIC